MELQSSDALIDDLDSDSASWPAEVQFILSALEAGRHKEGDNRRSKRRAFRVKATLQLFVDSAGSPPWTLYTRDVSRRSLGFITPHRLPLGYGGVVHLPVLSQKTILRLECVLLRCRETVNGWFEGAMYFNREQMSLADR